MTSRKENSEGEAVTISIRTRKSEVASWKQHAARRGITMSRYLRDSANDVDGLSTNTMVADADRLGRLYVLIQRLKDPHTEIGYADTYLAEEQQRYVSKYEADILQLTEEARSSVYETARLGPSTRARLDAMATLIKVVEATPLVPTTPTSTSTPLSGVKNTIITPTNPQLQDKHDEPISNHTPTPHTNPLPSSWIDSLVNRFREWVRRLLGL